MELTIKLNLLESRRKKAHKNYLAAAIADTHNSIVKDVISGADRLKLNNKARLFLKYNRRLK